MNHQTKEIPFPLGILCPSHPDRADVSRIDATSSCAPSSAVMALQQQICFPQSSARAHKGKVHVEILELSETPLQNCFTGAHYQAGAGYFCQKAISPPAGSIRASNCSGTPQLLSVL